MEYLGWLLGGIVIGGAGVFFLKSFRESQRDADPIAWLLTPHFAPAQVADITVTEREFPYRVRADLQCAMDRFVDAQARLHHFCGVRKEYSSEPITMSDCLIESEHYSAISVPPQYEELDIGNESPLRVLNVGLWMLESHDGIRFAVLLTPRERYGALTGMRVQIAASNTPAGTQLAESCFKSLEESVQRAECYRGKILSLETNEHSYSGESCGITVHSLRHVDREQVILPETTLQLLERNVIQFVQQRERLAHFKQSTKKGLLFYGPPGTGKTHTIHYLSRALAEHTTLLISAEQVGLLGEYMTLARLLQPSLVVLEDVDLIARDRSSMDNPCDEVLLNKLLNEMDGLREEAAILFVLTTNRPESLEAALASRPGRIDQAIEFPLPDAIGREKLIRLYSVGIQLGNEVLADIVNRTAGVSAAFIKELMRRAVQFHIERDGDGELSSDDILQALDEMLVRGGSLNMKLLGAHGQQPGQ